MTPAPRPIEVLLVEDDAGDELITREAFEHNKFNNRLHVARDGQEGLDFLYRRGAYQDAVRPDLILLDLNLPIPGPDGRDVLATIKGDPKTRLIPVLVLSGSTEDGDIGLCYQLGANAYIRKPGTLAEYVMLVERICAFWCDAALARPT